MADMAKDNLDKNFSEPKERTSNKHCRFCREPVPKLALAFSNSVAIENQFCCWICMFGKLGNDKAYRILEEKAKQNREGRKEHL